MIRESGYPSRSVNDQEDPGMAGNRKVALVTGAGHGIGRAIALQLAGNEFDVAVHYGRSQTEAADVVAAIERNGGRAKAIQGDLGRVADIEAVF